MLAPRNWMLARHHVPACIAALAAALVFFPADAVAQSKPAGRPPSTATPDASQAEARQRFNEGIALADAGDHEAARRKFEQAWALLKSPAVLYNLARAEQLSGQLVEALEHYRLFGRMANDPKIADVQRQRARENVAELSKKVGQIDVEAPASAHVSIDGRSVDTTAGDPIAVSTGKHVVEAVIDGAVRSVTVDAQPGTITKAKLTEEAPAVAPPSAAGERPAAKPPSSTESATLFSTRNVVVGSLGLASVVAGGVALGFLVDTNATVTDAKDFDASIPGGACGRRALPSCAEYTTRLDDASASRTVSYVAVAAAGALAIGGVLAFVLWPPRSGTPGATTRGALRALILGTTGGFRADF